MTSDCPTNWVPFILFSGYKHDFQYLYEKAGLFKLLKFINKLPHLIYFSLSLTLPESFEGEGCYWVIGVYCVFLGTCGVPSSSSTE